MKFSTQALPSLEDESELAGSIVFRHFDKLKLHYFDNKYNGNTHLDTFIHKFTLTTELKFKLLLNNGHIYNILLQNDTSIQKNKTYFDMLKLLNISCTSTVELRK